MARRNPDNTPAGELLSNFFKWESYIWLLQIAPLAVGLVAWRLASDLQVPELKCISYPAFVAQGLIWLVTAKAWWDIIMS